MMQKKIIQVSNKYTYMHACMHSLNENVCLHYAQ